MAILQPVLGEYIEIQLGNGASPEVFAHDIIINDSRSLSLTTNVEADELPDTADLSAPGQMVRRVRSLDLKVDGSGKLAKDSAYEWLERMIAGEIVNVKITQVGAEGWTITVPMVITSFQITGQRVKVAEASLTLEMANAFVLTKNA